MLRVGTFSSFGAENERIAGVRVAVATTDCVEPRCMLLRVASRWAFKTSFIVERFMPLLLVRKIVERNIKINYAVLEIMRRQSYSSP
mmetsp:Transcript_2957/g.4455  ORF Transcript_2957/g.4455 Transcript_2957/m.4455 type:complete len:87 (+) Transcript_2957:1463-1723(+)